MVFYNVICASKEDGGLDYISKDVDIRNLDWCTFVWDCLKDTKKPKTYYCGSVTLLMLIYLYCTKCDEVNVIRSRPAITSWTSDKIYHDLNVIGGANANREDQEIDTNDEDQVVEETAVALSYKQVEQMLLLISDLVVVIVSATCGGFAFACARQPAITGYLLAGSVIGPGGLSFVSELVRLRIVRAVAIMGGLLQIFLFMCLSGVIAVVLKFLMEKNSISTLYGQVTVGLCGGFIICAASDPRWYFECLKDVIYDDKVGDFNYVPGCFVVILPHLPMNFKLASVAFCLIVASSPAGVMISTTDHAQHTLEQVEPIRNFFAALFLASVGMLIHVEFLWNHIDILLAAVILVVVIKTFVVATIVKGFGYTNKTALLVRVYATSPVGMFLAQIGEFAFVILSRASNLHLIEVIFQSVSCATVGQVVGSGQVVSTASWHKSLVTTPFLFKPIPAIVHLGVLLRWFSPELPTKVLFNGELMPSDTAKYISLMIDVSHDL
ncbi:K(+) efflux antiporter 4 isoform X1 [Tanacetum coccineum]